MQSVEAISERILYWLSLDLRVRALAERLLHRFAVTVGDLPASAAQHHAGPCGLYSHSFAGRAQGLEELEGNVANRMAAWTAPSTASSGLEGPFRGSNCGAGKVS